MNHVTSALGDEWTMQMTSVLSPAPVWMNVSSCSISGASEIKIKFHYNFFHRSLNGGVCLLTKVHFNFDVYRNFSRLLPLKPPLKYLFNMCSLIPVSRSGLNHKIVLTQEPSKFLHKSAFIYSVFGSFLPLYKLLTLFPPCCWAAEGPISPQRRLMREEPLNEFAPFFGLNSEK